MTLSKSNYIRGLQCHKSLWLYKHRREILDEFPADSGAEARFAVGHEVGELAQQYFPGGVEVAFNADDFGAMRAQTAELIKAGQRTIYEATFQHRGVFVRADILHKVGDAWDMIEVKSSTSVKNYHRDDAAVQWLVLRDALPLGRAFIMHINRDYVRGKVLDLKQLFTLADITDAVLDAQQSVGANLAAMKNMLQQNEPQIDIGAHCSSPFACDFAPHCWRHVPQQSVFNLYRLNWEKRFDLYHRGLIHMQDAAPHIQPTKIQSLQLQTRERDKPHIDKTVLREFIAQVAHPIGYLDFETFMNAVPRFVGERPYSQLPFQYSLHIENQSGELQHKEFLGDERGDPRRALAEHLLRDLPAHGAIMAFNAGFEKGCIRALAAHCPDLSDSLLALLPRFVDLVQPFRRGGYYHADFNGGFSLKAVLPALFPDDAELSYAALAIQDGDMAMQTFADLHRVKDADAREKIRQDLIAYCKLDTLAMVKIFARLRDAA